MTYHTVNHNTVLPFLVPLGGVAAFNGANNAWDHPHWMQNNDGVAGGCIRILLD